MKGKGLNLVKRIAELVSGKLEAAAQRGSSRGRFARAPVPAGTASVVVYAALFSISAYYIVTAWLFPMRAGHVFEGIAALGVTLMVINAVWCALLVAEGVENLTDPAGRSPFRIVLLTMGLVLVALVQWGATLMYRAAFW